MWAGDRIIDVMNFLDDGKRTLPIPVEFWRFTEGYGWHVEVDKVSGLVRVLHKMTVVVMLLVLLSLLRFLAHTLVKLSEK